MNYQKKKQKRELKPYKVYIEISLKEKKNIISIEKKWINKFKTNQERVKERKVLFEIINTKTIEIFSNDLIGRCLQKNIPIGEINTLEKVMKSEIAEEMILEEIIDNQKTRRIKTVAFKLSS